MTLKRGPSLPPSSLSPRDEADTFWCLSELMVEIKEGFMQVPYYHSYYYNSYYYNSYYYNSYYCGTDNTRTSGGRGFRGCC